MVALALVQLGSLGLGTLWDREGNALESVVPTLSTDVYKDSSVDAWLAANPGEVPTVDDFGPSDVLAPEFVITDADGELPGWVAEGVHTMETATKTFTLHVIDGRLPVLSDSAAGALEGTAGRTSTLRNPVLRDFVSAHDASYGVMHNGTTDDTAGLLLAVAAARAAGKRLWVPAGTHKVSAAICNPTDLAALRLTGDGDETTEFVQASGMTEAVIQLTGTIATSVALTAPASRGDYQLTLASTAGMTAGEFLRLLDLTNPIYGDTTRTAVSGAAEFVRIKTVNSGTQVTLRGALEYAYSTSGTARRLSPVTCDLEGFTIRNLAPGTQAATARGIDLTYYAEARIGDVGFESLDAHHINAIRGVGGHIKNLRAVDSQDLETANTPYVVSLSTSQGVLVTGLRARGVRHVYTAGGGTNTGVSSHNRISDAIVEEATATAFDTQPGATHTSFVNCHAVHSFPTDTFLGSAYEISGFQIRGPDCAIVGCTVVGAKDRGAYIVDGADRCRVAASSFMNCNVGIEVDDSHDVYIGGGTMIKTPTVDGIKTNRSASYASAMTRILIGEVLVTGDPTGYAFNQAVSGLGVVYL